MLKKISFFLLLMISFQWAKAQENRAVHNIDKVAFQQGIEKGNVQLVDVRTPEEYKNGFIKNAVNIDYLNKKIFENSFEKFDKSKPIYIYCQSGGRSNKAAKKLAEMGFKEIYDLQGGYYNW